MSGFCTQCGAARTGAKFCTSCGAEQKAAVPSAPVAPHSHGLKCVECNSSIDSGLVCARCASRPRAVGAPSVPTASAPSSTPASQPRQFPWYAVVAFWACAITIVLVWADGKMHGQLWASVSQLVSRGDGLDGTYVCGDYGVPLKVTIRNGRADIDLGFLKGEGVLVKRHGSTLSLSGGRAYDGMGNPIDAKTRSELSGGNDVDLMTIGDDGQTLTAQIGDGREAVFVRQLESESYW